MSCARHDLTGFANFIPEWLAEHNLGSDGAYARYTAGRSDGPDPYGCADAANILYTIGAFPQDPQVRARWVAQLRSFQDPADGMFRDATHSMYHTTAHCVAALELFDAAPRHQLATLTPLLERAELERFLRDLKWDRPWRSSHDGAGCAAALAITGEAPATWFDWYFAWLDENVDPETGFWLRDHQLPKSDVPGWFENLAGSFHYHFNYVHFRRPLPYPERVVDSCLEILASSPLELATSSVSFPEIDWIFCVNRAMRQSGHRRSDVIAALNVMADRVVAVLNDDAYRRSETFDDVHMAFGAVCAVAELQQALPGVIDTPRPFKLVLDRRPFI
jgi:hypothetical protein